MDADLKLFISIICSVAGVLLFFNVVRGIKNRKYKQFSSLIMGAKDELSRDQDPLFEDITTEKSSPVKGKNEDKNKHFDGIFALYILSKSHNGFSGRALESAVRSNQFYFGKHKIFHRHIDDNFDNPTLFSVASITEPGFFEISSMQKQFFKGVVIFMTTHGKADPIATFEAMLTAAQKITTMLNGELCDNQRSHLTAQTVAHYKELIRDEHRKHLSQKVL